MKMKHSLWKSYRFSVFLLTGIAIGCILGILLGKQATVLAPFGDIFLNLMFTVVVPMVFVSIATAVGNMLNMKRLGKILADMILVFIVTGLIAAVLVLLVVHWFPPAAGTHIALKSAAMSKPTSVGDMIVGALTVDDFAGLMKRANMLPIIVAAILFGFCVSACGSSKSPVGKFMNNLNDIIMKLVNVIMLYAPIGLGAYFANLIGKFGPNLLGDYGHAMLIYYPLCLVYALIAFPAYSFFAGGSLGVRQMVKNITNPAITAFATQSSVATLPVNMDSCDKIGVPKDIRDIVLPMGATMHMDGSVLAAILKISFLYGVFGQSFTGAGTYAKSIFVAILSAFVLSGAPGGGLVGEMLIVNLFGYPSEAFPLIATIGFLVDPPATCINAAGDTVASMMVTRLVEGKDWLTRRLQPKQTEPEKQ